MFDRVLNTPLATNEILKYFQGTFKLLIFTEKKRNFESC